MFPMVPAGADLADMIRRPKREILAETGADKEWQMPTTSPEATLTALASQPKAAATKSRPAQKAAPKAAAKTRRAPAKSVKARRR